MSDQFLIAYTSRSKIRRSVLKWAASDRKPFEPFDPVDLDEAVLDSVFSLYQACYKPVSKALIISDKYGLFKYNRWIIVKNREDRLIGFVLGKATEFGFKIALTGSDGSAEGRQAIKDFHRKVFHVDGVYAEVSHQLEKVVTGHAPLVDAETARTVLSPKSIRPSRDGHHYKRKIVPLSGLQEKVMVGKPIVSP